MKQLKLITILSCLFAIVLCTNILNANDVHFSSTKIATNNHNVLVMLDINSMAETVDLIKYPYLAHELNELKINQGEDKANQVRNFSENIIVDGDAIDIKTRKDQRNIHHIYENFKRCFENGHIDGNLGYEHTFKDEYVDEMNLNGNSLSKTLEGLFKNALGQGTGNKLIELKGIEDKDKSNFCVRDIWTKHVAGSIINKLKIDNGSEDNVTNGKFILVPPKLSANHVNFKYLIDTLKITDVLRIDRNNNCELLFQKTIMPNEKVFNIFVDGHHTNHVATIKKLIKNKLIELGMDSEIKKVNAGTLEAYSYMTKFIEEHGLLDEVLESIKKENGERNDGIETTMKHVKDNLKHVVFKNTSLEKFKQELFKSRESYDIDAHTIFQSIKNIKDNR